MRCSAQFTPPPLREMRGAERCIDEQPSSVVNASVIPLSRCRRARAQAPSRRLHRAELPCSVAVADQETTRLADMHAFTNTDPRQNMFTQRSKDGEEVWPCSTPRRCAILSASLQSSCSVRAGRARRASRQFGAQLPTSDH